MMAYYFPVLSRKRSHLRARRHRYEQGWRRRPHQRTVQQTGREGITSSRRSALPVWRRHGSGYRGESCWLSIQVYIWNMVFEKNYPKRLKLWIKYPSPLLPHLVFVFFTFLYCIVQISVGHGGWFVSTISEDGRQCNLVWLQSSATKRKHWKRQDEPRRLYPLRLPYRWRICRWREVATRLIDSRRTLWFAEIYLI